MPKAGTPTRIALETTTRSKPNLLTNEASALGMLHLLRPSRGVIRNQLPLAPPPKKQACPVPYLKNHELLRIKHDAAESKTQLQASPLFTLTPSKT